MCAHLPARPLLVEALHLAGTLLLCLHLQRGGRQGWMAAVDHTGGWAWAGAAPRAGRQALAGPAQAMPALCATREDHAIVMAMVMPPALPRTHLLPQRTVLRLQRRDLHLRLGGLLLQRRQAGHSVS